MSNFEEEKPQTHADEYHRALKKLRKAEADRVKAYDLWQADTYEDKPTASQFEHINGGALKTEKDIHTEAQDIANRRTERQQKLQEAGLVEEPKQNLTFEEKLKAKLGAEKVERAKEQRREAQQVERELAQKREGRGFET